MLIAVERLLLKLRQPASRAGELIELHRRLRAEVRSEPAAEEHVLAAAILDQKRQVSALLDAVTSCRSCATGQPFPTGHFAGGACCAGVTNELFDDNELAALAHAGTRVGDLAAPRTDHAGCAFRGAHGCTLEVSHRPARCVRYVCDTLWRELHDLGRLAKVEAELAELDRRVHQFRAVREERVDRQVLAPLIEAIAEARRS
ncbi:MAG: hypothetical protein ABI678_03365 [Kofleriaceae bacterium]